MTSHEMASLAGTWTLDPVHSRIGFATRHAMVAKVRGAFNDVSGSAFIDLDDPERSHVEVTVKMASVDTRNAERDNHLRAADFFDVERFPDMTFRSTRLEEVDQNAWIVTGDLTIRDITRSVGLPLEVTGVTTDAFGDVRAGLEGSRRLDRRDWGVTWNTPLAAGGLMLSEKITLEFELSLVRQKDDAATGDKVVVQRAQDGTPADDTPDTPWPATPRN